MSKEVHCKKNIVTHQDVKLFFTALKVHLPLLNVFIKKDGNSVFCGEFKKQDDQTTVEVKVYISEPVTIKELIQGRRVKVTTDWHEHDRLWFKVENGEPSAYIEYMDGYRDDFKVSKDKPCVKFTVNY